MKSLVSGDWSYGVTCIPLLYSVLVEVIWHFISSINASLFYCDWNVIMNHDVTVTALEVWICSSSIFWGFHLKIRKLCTEDYSLWLCLRKKNSNLNYDRFKTSLLRRYIFQNFTTSIFGYFYLKNHSKNVIRNYPLRYYSGNSLTHHSFKVTWCWL